MTPSIGTVDYGVSYALLCLLDFLQWFPTGAGLADHERENPWLANQ